VLDPAEIVAANAAFEVVAVVQISPPGRAALVSGVIIPLAFWLAR
jgi:hypothetical protein